MSNNNVIQHDSKFKNSSKEIKSSKVCKNKTLSVDATPDSSRRKYQATNVGKNKTLSVDATPDSSRRKNQAIGRKAVASKKSRDKNANKNKSLDVDVTPKSSRKKLRGKQNIRKSWSKITNKSSSLDVDVTPRSSRTKHHVKTALKHSPDKIVNKTKGMGPIKSKNQVAQKCQCALKNVGSNHSLDADATPVSSRTNIKDEKANNILVVDKTQRSTATDVTQKSNYSQNQSNQGDVSFQVVRSPEMPKKETSRNVLSVDNTQDDDFPFHPSQPKEQPLRSRKSVMDLINNYSKRVRYTKHLDETGITLNDEPVDNEKTIRDEKRFLKRIEKCKFRKLQRICVCPLTKCYRLIDRFDNFKTIWHRIRRIVWIACCPPLCCLIPRVAFWPPRCEYYFYKPPKNDVRIDVRNDRDAVEMKKRKKRLRKYKKATRCSLSDRYHFGMSHPCANDIDHVEGFVLKTSQRKRIACIYIQCPDGSPRFTMIYSHPNGSDLSDHLVGVPSLVDIARFYRCDVYSYDYTGYGISQGSPGERNMYSDIRAVYDYVTIEKRVPPKRIILLGYSIGSAVTIELLKREKPAGAILQAPPTSIIRVLKHFIGKTEDTKSLENKTCCLDRFRTIDKMKYVKVPILIIHGVNDKTVPIEHGKIICERAITKVAPTWVPSAGHDNIENCREVWIRIRQFVRTELGLDHNN